MDATRSTCVVIDVLGTPAPKGSGRAMLVAGRAQHVPSGSDVNARAIRAWDTAVRGAAALAVGDATAPPFVGRALRMTAVWRMRRPAGHYGKSGLRPRAPVWPITKPDGSKLLRATEDSLTGIVWDDDSRIVEWFLRKTYATPGHEGATIIVEAIT